MSALRLRTTGRPLPEISWGAGAVLIAATGSVLYALSAYAVSPIALPALAIGAVVVVVAFRRPVWGLAAALLATPLELLSLPLPSGSLSPSEGLFVVVALGWLWRGLLGDNAIVRPSLRDGPIVAFLAVFAVGAIVAVQPSLVLRGLALWISFYFLYLQVQSLDPAEMRIVLLAFVGGAGILGAIGAASYLSSGTTGLLFGGSITETRATGTFIDPNYYASFLILAIVPVLALVVGDFRRNGRALPLLFAAIAGLIFSLSRGGILGLAAGIVVLLLLSTRARRVAGVAVLVVGVLTVANANPVVKTDQFGTLKERLSTVNGSLGQVDVRPRIWSTAVDIAQQNALIGVGWDQFQSAAASHGLFERGQPVQNAHNTPLDLAAQLGFLGLAAFVAFIAQLTARAVRALRAREPLARALALGLLAALSGFFLQSLTQAQLRVNVIAATIFVFWGMITALADRQRTASRPSTPRTTP